MQRQLALLEGNASGDGTAASVELRSRVIEQQQALMARQLSFLAGGAPTTGTLPGFDGIAETDAIVAMEETLTMGNAKQPHGVMDARYPIVPGARLGRDPEGHPAWFVANPERPGKFLKVGG